MQENKTLPRVCYFGTYERDYARNALLISNLKKQGLEVIECQEPLWVRTQYKGNFIGNPILRIKVFFRIIGKYFLLLRRYIKLGKFDVLVTGYPSYIDVYVARLLNLFSKKKIIFDAYISLYDTSVSDRKILAKKPLMSYLVYQLERWACICADIVLVETDECGRYFSEFYKIKRDKFKTLYTSADDTLYFPRNTASGKKTFDLIYYGSFIPFHGLEYIIDAAERLNNRQDIRFRLFGDGQLKNDVEERLAQLKLPNVILEGYCKPQNLTQIIAGADVCLGIFGTSNKARCCLTNKVCEALAMGKPLITEESPVTGELFVDKQHLVLVPAGNGKALAEAILYLKDNPDKRQQIADAGYRLFIERLAPNKIAEEFKRMIIYTWSNNGSYY